MALGTSYVYSHFNVVRVHSESMRGPCVYQLNFIIKRKKGTLRPYLEPRTQKKWAFRVPTASDILTSRIKDGADAAAFESIRIGLFSASMHRLQCTWHD